MKNENKKFNNIKNDYEMNLKNEKKVIYCNEDD
jgi:hypothetical protein